MRLLRAAWSRRHISGRAAEWAAWDAFADLHRFDPEAATDAQLVAFTLARATAGVSWSTCWSFLWLYREVIEGDGRLVRPDGAAASVTVPAVRLLSDLHDDGLFDPAVRQAPLLTLGQVRALEQAALSVPVGPEFAVELVRARDRMLVDVGYCAGLRPGEWSWVDLEHVQVRDGRLVVLLPETKTGEFQKVTVEPVEGLDPGGVVEAYLALRGDGPGPLVVDGRVGHGLRRVSSHAIGYRLRQVAAQAGISAFAPYSLRRSMAAHMQLLGIAPEVIQQRLRHSRRTSTFRRYVEPLLVVMGQDEARARWLDPTVPAASPVPLESVRAHPDSPKRAAVPLAFAAGTVESLLEDVDLPGLRVPARLSQTGASTLEGGRRQLRAFARWAEQSGGSIDPTRPGKGDVVRWVRERLDNVQPQSVMREVAALEVGLVDATGRQEWPELALGHAIASGAYSKALDEGTVAPKSTQKKSRPATDDDLRVILPEAVTPGQSWAVSLVRLYAKGRPCRLVDVADDEVAVVVGGHRARWRAADGMLCPVAAAEVLLDHGVTSVEGGEPSLARVFSAAKPALTVLRDRLVLKLAHGSGARPSDLARARVAGVQVRPEGVLVVLSVTKGARPGARGRAEALWAPQRDDSLDPVAAWNEWASWWPFPDGPLVPSLARPARLAAGVVKRLSNAATGNLATLRWKGAGLSGLTFYGFRYGRAGVMHDEGFSILEIAEALNQDDTQVTEGYIQNLDAFADIDWGRDPIMNAIRGGGRS